MCVPRAQRLCGAEKGGKGSVPMHPSTPSPPARSINSIRTSQLMAGGTEALRACRVGTPQCPKRADVVGARTRCAIASAGAPLAPPTYTPLGSAPVRVSSGEMRPSTMPTQLSMAASNTRPRRLSASPPPWAALLLSAATRLADSSGDRSVKRYSSFRVVGTCRSLSAAWLEARRDDSALLAALRGLSRVQSMRRAWYRVSLSMWQQRSVRAVVLQPQVVLQRWSPCSAAQRTPGWPPPTAPHLPPTSCLQRLARREKLPLVLLRLLAAAVHKGLHSTMWRAQEGIVTAPSIVGTCVTHSIRCIRTHHSTANCMASRGAGRRSAQ